jgi:heavy metal translocating P-type ATPase
VPAGARNLESILFVEVTRISSDSTLSKIIQLIIQASEAKPRLQNLLDKFGKHYATAIISLTFIFAFTLPLLLSTSYFGYEGSIYRALAFLIAASPCALIIATPTAYLSAISACAKKGILLKGGITLDALASCSIIAFDKTGTLTTGELSCVNFQALNGSDGSLKNALSIAYGLEQQVTHPIAKAICKLAQEKQIPPAEILAFKTVPGSGLEGKVENRLVAIGLPEYIADKLPPDKREELQRWTSITKQKGQILAALLVETQVFIFQFSDEVRKNTAELLHKMKQTNKLRPIMLTGDHAVSAKEVGAILGLDEIFADLRPEDKLAKVAELSKTCGLAMVGDGINDAPALARATVGISMGRIGSATAVDASDVVLLNDDLHLLSWVFTKSHQTKRIVKQNLGAALAVICFATIPALLGLVPLWAAVIMHEGGTVLVGLNSLRLLRK